MPVGLLVGALIAVAAVLAPTAAADEQLQSTGGVVYAWHGDPARGCAQAGVCGVHGTLVMQPQGGAILSSSPFSSALSFNDASATVRVQEGDLGSGGVCVDQPAAAPGVAILMIRPGGTVSASFSGTGSRCAGPLGQELGRASIHGRRSGGAKPSFDLRSSVPFTAGPYSGTLHSTLVLRPGNVGGFSSSGSSGSSSSAPKPHRVLVERVVMRFRAAALPGALTIPFGGEAGPFCAALDACGATGSISLAIPARQWDLEIAASRAVGVGVGRRRVFADFRAGRLQFEAGVPLGLPGTRLNARFRGAGGGSCADASSVPNTTLAFGSFGPPNPSRPALPVALATFSNDDPLRTHCPGPAFADAFGTGQTLLSASIPRSQLLQHHSVVTLRAHGGFNGPGFSGTLSGSVQVSLTLRKVVGGTQSELLP